eukprot:2223904-Rhodomonas_salina.1
MALPGASQAASSDRRDLIQAGPRRTKRCSPASKIWTWAEFPESAHGHPFRSSTHLYLSPLPRQEPPPNFLPSRNFSYG